MMRFIQIVLAAFVLSVATPALAQEWIEYESLEDAFAVNFPTQPEIREIAYPSEYGVNLPARVYSSVDGKSRYSVTVVDYRNVQQLHAERLKGCKAYPNTCGNPSGNELRGAIDFALFSFLQKDLKFTHYAYYTADQIEGRRLQLLHPDQSRTFAAIHMHQNRLYIFEGMVPPGSPPPGLFQQSVTWIDKDRNRIRYRSLYSNNFPAPPLQLELSPLEGRER
jgi:hypothetical protein